MDNKKKQHYIPQLLLKKFACNETEKKIWVLDKSQKSIRNCSIEDVCEENYFYRLPISKIISEGKLSDEDYYKLDEACLKDYGKHIEDLTDDELNKADYAIENYFSDFIEPYLSRFIDKIIYNTYEGNKWVIENCYFISEKDKHDFSWFLAKEYIRTKHSRDTLTNLMEQSYKRIIPVTAQFYGIKIKEEDVGIEYTKDQIKLHHAQSILNDEECELFSSIFYSNIWVLLENFTDEPFCCIDNTLMLNPTSKLLPYMGYGLATHGMTTYIPITPKLMIVMLEPTKFKENYINKDRKIAIIDDIKKIENINKGLICEAYKYVIFNGEVPAKKYKRICDNNQYLYEEASKGQVL